MSPMSEDELIDQIIHWVRENRHAEISADTDLIATGLLDSLGVVDLFMFIEGLIGCKIDLTDVDLSEFSVPKGLCSVALRSRQNYLWCEVDHRQFDLGASLPRSEGV